MSVGKQDIYVNIFDLVLTVVRLTMELAPLCDMWSQNSCNLAVFSFHRAIATTS